MQYEVQTQVKVGTLDLLVWIIRADPQTRAIEVIRGEEWVPTEEGENVPPSLKIPWRVQKQLKEMLP